MIDATNMDGHEIADCVDVLHKRVRELVCSRLANSPLCSYSQASELRPSTAPRYKRISMWVLLCVVRWRYALTCSLHSLRTLRAPLFACSSMLDVLRMPLKRLPVFLVTFWRRSLACCRTRMINQHSLDRVYSRIPCPGNGSASCKYVIPGGLLLYLARPSGHLSLSQISSPMMQTQTSSIFA